MKLRGWILALLALCLLASPSDARLVGTEEIGSVASAATGVTGAFKIGSVDSPIVVIVGFTSNATQNVLFTVEGTIDGTNWVSPGLTAATPSALFSETVTGTGGYVLFPFVMVSDTGSSGTGDIIANPCNQIRVRYTNQGATAITNLRIQVIGG